MRGDVFDGHKRLLQVRPAAIRPQCLALPTVAGRGTDRPRGIAPFIVASLGDGTQLTFTPRNSDREFLVPNWWVLRVGILVFSVFVVENATKYEVTPTIELDIRDIDIQVMVLDRGPGIPSHAFETVFVPFQRLDPSRSRDTGGWAWG